MGLLISDLNRGWNQARAGQKCLSRRLIYRKLGSINESIKHRIIRRIYGTRIPGKTERDG